MKKNVPSGLDKCLHAAPPFIYYFGEEFVVRVWTALTIFGKPK